MSTQTQRGRRVAKKTNSQRNFVYLVGGLVVALAAFIIALLVLNNTGVSSSPVNAPVGRTAEGFYYKGNPEAAVTVIEFADFQCPACANYHLSLAPIINRDYVETGRIQFIFQEFPLEMHRNAVPAAQAARCAADQDPAFFWPMHDQIFNNQASWSGVGNTLNAFTGYARAVGADATAFQACVNDGTHLQEIAASVQSGVALGVQATPTFSVNGQLVNADQLPSVIDAALRAAGQ
jgi:protein-disulfide isomerase